VASNPWYDPERSHHTRRGFRNPPGNPRWHRPTPGIARAFARFGADLLRLRNTPLPFSDQHALSKERTLRGMAECQSDRKATWLGHASFLLDLDGCRVLTDPFLSDYASPLPSPTFRRLVPPALTVDELPEIHVILVSHNHYDHLDVTSLKRLAKRFPDARVMVPLGLASTLQRCGFRHVGELDWYDREAAHGVTVTAVPAIHMTRRGLADQNRTLWCGFSVGHEDWQGYFAGDTAHGPVFEGVGEKLGPFDLALVPIGAYEPRQLMHCVHATPEDAVLIAEQIGARRAIGMHWGTIRLTTEPMDEPPKRFLAGESTLPREVMAIGETRGV